MDEEQIRALIREEVAKAFGVLRESADWYTNGYGEITEATARVIWDVAERTLSDLTSKAPEPANPFAPKYTSEQWAEAIRALIKEAKTDGYDVWVDVEDYFGPGPFVRISSSEKESGWENDPILWRNDD